MVINTQYVDLLKRAFPHLDDRRRQSVSVILKLSELNDTLNNLKYSNQLSACSTNNSSQINSEELLKSIRPVCSKREQEMIDLVIGFSKSKEIMSAYRKISGDNSSLSAYDMLKNQFSSEQLDIINQLGKLINE